MIIDFHTHIMAPWVAERREELARRDPCFGELYSDSRAKLATAEDLIRSMDEAEVSASVVLNIGWSEHDLCVRTNDYLLECGDRWPGRIIPFCMVQPAAGEPALRELERCAAAGARGVGELRPDVQGFSLLDSDLLSPLVHAATTAGMHLLTHCSEPVGHVYSGKGTVAPAQVYGFARAFPEVSLVCAHWGGGLPFYELMPEVGRDLSNTCYDTAATQYLYRPDVFQAVASIIGEQRMLFGSDFPLIRQQRALEHIHLAELPRAVEAALLGANATRLLGMETSHG